MNAGNQHDHRSEQIRKLFHSYGSLMYQIAFSILKQAQNAEDAVQETLLKMIEKAENLPYDNPDAIRAYIFVMTRNTALDLRRRMQHQISTDMNAEEIVRESLKIASSICVYTNDHITVEKLEGEPDNE